MVSAGTVCPAACSNPHQQPNAAPHGGHQSADDGGGGTGVAENGFGLLDLGTVDEAHVAHAAVGKGVDNGAAQPACQSVVDQCAEVGTQGGKNHDQHNVHALVGHGFPRGGRHHYL